jgi:hypothetical protein
VQTAPNWWVFVRDFVSADDRLNVTDLFDAAVSAAQNPVSRKQRPTVVETRIAKPHKSSTTLRKALKRLYRIDAANTTELAKSSAKSRSHETARKSGFERPAAGNLAFI